YSSCAEVWGSVLQLQGIWACIKGMSETEMTKMLLCKQEEAGVQLNAEQANWKDDTDDEFDDQELEAHYMYMAQLQEVTPDQVDIILDQSLMMSQCISSG
ncbi:hypothetical protein Tco_0358145, partial [Tanacetum coccineum]